MYECCDTPHVTCTRCIILLHKACICVLSTVLCLTHLDISEGARGSIVIEALSYKPEGHGISSR
jgi:hypothetical protein